MGRRLRVVEITLQAGESATSGVLWFILRAEIESGDPGARAGRRDIQIPYYRIDVPYPRFCFNPARHPIDRYRGRTARGSRASRARYTRVGVRRRS